MQLPLTTPLLLLTGLTTLALSSAIPAAASSNTEIHCITHNHHQACSPSLAILCAHPVFNTPGVAPPPECSSTSLAGQRRAKHKRHNKLCTKKLPHHTTTKDTTTTTTTTTTTPIPTTSTTSSTTTTSTTSTTTTTTTTAEEETTTSTTTTSTSTTTTEPPLAEPTCTPPDGECALHDPGACCNMVCFNHEYFGGTFPFCG